MTIESTQKALQFYTGTYLDQVKGRQQTIYNKYSGLCLETQNFTDSVNHQVNPIFIQLDCIRVILAGISKYDSSSEWNLLWTNNFSFFYRIKTMS